MKDHATILSKNFLNEQSLWMEGLIRSVSVHGFTCTVIVPVGVMGMKLLCHKMKFSSHNYLTNSTKLMM